MSIALFSIFAISDNEQWAFATLHPALFALITIVYTTEYTLHYYVYLYLKDGWLYWSSYTYTVYSNASPQVYYWLASLETDIS